MPNEKQNNEGVNPLFHARGGQKGVNPAERAALDTAVGTVWPYSGEFPTDRFFFWNGGWKTYEELEKAFEGWKPGALWGNTPTFPSGSTILGKNRPPKWQMVPTAPI